MRKLVVLLFFLLPLCAVQVTGQSYKQQFNELFSKKDTLGQKQLLDRWEKADRNDPELFVAQFNYYVVLAKKEIIALGQDPKGADVLQVMDQDTSNKEPIAFIYGDHFYDPELLSKGFDRITKGINLHPDRLDMRFGKIYMLGEISDYKAFTKEIMKTIDYADVNKNKWTWADNKPLDDPKEFMLSSIQNYQTQMYNTGDDELLDNMKRIAETILTYYPDHVESLSNIAIVYMLQDQYDKALASLLIAAKINPQDHIVLSNIAQVYKLKGDKTNAITYYELVVKHGDPETKKYAKEQISELKKK